MRSGNKYRGVFIFTICILTGIFCIVYHETHLADSFETIVLETAHLPVLLPHEHDAGEAVEDLGHHHYLYSKVFVAPKDLWISDASFDLINAPDTADHHTALLNLDGIHQTCKKLPYEQLFGFPQDMLHEPKISFPEGTGMKIKKGEHIVFMLMLHNPLPPIGPGETYHDVYGKLTLTFRPDSESGNLKNVKFHLIHLDQIPCEVTYSDKSLAFMFTVPSHSKDFTYSSPNSKDDPSRFTFATSSVIVYTGGHLHGWEGGKALHVYKNGEDFLDFTTYPSPNYPFRYDSQYRPTFIKIAAGDTLSLSAVYDNPNDVAIRGAMGMLEMYYYEE